MQHIHEIKSLITNLTDADISLMETENISFDSNRKAIIRNADSLDFQAVPGSGKTTLLVSKLLLISNKWNFNDCGICVLSHTNVAKEEIKRKILKNNLDKKLLKYPHFIGTIQEFVDKYLAYPIIRNLGYKARIVDTELARERINNSLSFKAKSYLEIKNTFIDLTITSINPLQFKMPIGLSPKAPTYTELYAKKEQSLKDGYFFYDDMYAFANYLLDSCTDYAKNIRERFPLIFIDEAQDNDSKQDNLLEKVFNDDACIYQRFGDSDQAIYSFNISDEQNTFGCRISAINVNDSKRFPSNHIDLINKFKISSINLTALPKQPKHLPQIIMYSETTKSQVIPKFLELIDTYFEAKDCPVVKIIGFIASSENPKNSIKDYLENYEKKRKTDKIETLIELIYNLKASQHIEINKAFYKIVAFILKKHNILYDNSLLNVQKKSLIRCFLNENDPTHIFSREVIKILSETITENIWSEFCECVCKTFKISQLDNTYILHFVPDVTSISVAKTPQTLKIKCDNNNCLYTPIKKIKVEIDTIHGVKGETHDATLVLETSYYTKDVSCCLKDAKSKNKEKFKKQLYVATTRAKSLLCIAIDESANIGNIANTQIIEL